LYIVRNENNFFEKNHLQKITITILDLDDQLDRFLVVSMRFICSKWESYAYFKPVKPYFVKYSAHI